MVFQVRKWGWKRLASKLLLIPVLTGGAAAVAQAQFSSGSTPTAGQTPSAQMSNGMTSTSDDPKVLLEQGRKALAAGDFNRAQDLCRSAEAHNPGGRWGLFEDTPNALQRDIRTAQVRVQRAQSEQLTKQAKALFLKPAGNDMERQANLNQALQMAQRAELLHGAYNAWDFGDRADKLLKEIQDTLAHLYPSGMPATGQQSTPVTPAGAMAARNMPADAKKAAAVQLMSEARKLADQGLFGSAKAKLMEADRLGANFSPNDYTPLWALQELNARGTTAIDRLVAEAKSQMNKKDYAKAETALNAATEVAQALNLYAQPIEVARAQLRTFSKSSAGNVAATGASNPDVPVPTMPTVPRLTPTPGVMSSVASVPENGSGPMHLPVSGSALTPKQLLDQADLEFRKGDLDMAESLARKAHNAGAQDEARRMLNSIDAERLKLKTINASRSLDAAQAAFKSKDYSQAAGVLVLIDPKLLTVEQKTRRDELLSVCRAEAAKAANVGVKVDASVAMAGSPQAGEPPVLPVSPGSDGQVTNGANPPGIARLESNPSASADNIGNQIEAMRRDQFQKFRTEGNKIVSDANATFGRGDPDLAIQMLVDYEGRVRAANLEPSSTTLLLRPIDTRLDMYRVMRGNQIAISQQNRENAEKRELVRDRSGSADDQRHAEIKKIFEQYRNLTKEGKYVEAEKVALQAKQLDPDNPACTALAEQAKLLRAHKDADKIKDDKERMFRLGLNKAEEEGPLVDLENPIAFQLNRSRIASQRGSGDSYYLKTRTPATYEIELKLTKPISVNFDQTPLEQAIENLQTTIDIPMMIDRYSLEAEGISAVRPITVKPGAPVAAKHMLAVTLEQAGLSYVIENDMVKVTTQKKAKGRLFTKVFSVADLVTPVPNFSLPDYANFEKMMQAGTGNFGKDLNKGIGNMPIAPANGMNGGVLAGSQATMPGIGSSPNIPGGPGGTLQSNPFGDRSNPLGYSTNLSGPSNTKHEQLIKLITTMIRPYTWDGMGGPGRAEFYDIGSALVVNQTADVIQEVSDLLEALRRLQDLAIAVEVRIVSLSESWFERMGVDFSVNILTNSKNQGVLQTQLTQVDQNTGAAGVFAPLPYLNALGNAGATVGLTPAGTFTPDLNVPLTNSSFAMAVPPFGGYPNTPGADGGISLGLAFLNEIQVYLFMEAAAGDRRVNVMQAPKLTLFNGQTSSITVNNTQFYVTNVQVISVNGQIVFSPTNTPFPGPGDFQTGGVLSVTIQGVVSADRRFVRLNMPVTMSAQTGTTVPLFPVTTFVTPVFEGGSQGQPIPFTQFLQQPAFTDLTINTTVVCPDGGTVLLGGFKQLSEGRNEFGPPFLSDIPYLNRLFKNVGIGRETTHIMIMVTPRIIINSEEEIFQTEGRPQP